MFFVNLRTLKQRCVTDDNIELMNLHYSGTLSRSTGSTTRLDKRAQLNSKKFVVPQSLPKRQVRGARARNRIK